MIFKANKMFIGEKLREIIVDTNHYSCCNKMTDSLDSYSFVLRENSKSLSMNIHEDNYVEFNYCPFCSKEINIEFEELKMEDTRQNFLHINTTISNEKTLEFMRISTQQMQEQLNKLLTGRR